MRVLGDLIFVSVVLKKASNSKPYCEFFSKQQAQKAKVQNTHFEETWVYKSLEFKEHQVIETEDALQRQTKLLLMILKCR